MGSCRQFWRRVRDVISCSKSTHIKQYAAFGRFRLAAPVYTYVHPIADIKYGWSVLILMSFPLQDVHVVSCLDSRSELLRGRQLKEATQTYEHYDMLYWLVYQCNDLWHASPGAFSSECPFPLDSFSSGRTSPSTNYSCSPREPNLAPL